MRQIFPRFPIRRERSLDLIILTASLLAICGGLGMIIYCLFFFKEYDHQTGEIISQAPVIQITPYAMFSSLILLGFLGIKYFRKETEL